MGESPGFGIPRRLVRTRRDPAPAAGIISGAPPPRAHARGYRVYVWTVNEPWQVDFVRGLGVDAVVSDRPAMVIERLAADTG